MIDPGDLHGMVDVLDDLLPAHSRQQPLLHRVAIEPLALQNRACFVGSALLRDRLALRLELGTPRRGAEFFAEEGGVIIDHHHAAVLRERAQHVVGHVARRVREGATRRV